MCINFVFALFLSAAHAATSNESRYSITGLGQGIADVFLGEVYGRVSGTEFAGGIAAVYQNQKEGQSVVSTTGGMVRGLLTSTSRDNTPYTAYMGIPYAKPPVGTLRFQAPQDPEPWKGILDGRKEGHSCVSFREPKKGSEDCLFLNVFTPHIGTNASFPVMVFIYGGAFIGGSSNTSGYAPDFLVDKNIVLVTFNYRVGPLGFLSLQTDKVPGNAGLKDQTMALKWVQRNIHSFGGDPKKVTIFGESAGAASVGYHLLSPLSKGQWNDGSGLFQRAVMESGSPLASWAYIEPSVALARAFGLGEKIGCSLPNTPDQQLQFLHQCLLDAPPPLLAKAQFTGLSIQDLLHVRTLAFVPTSEPPRSKGAFVTKKPEQYLLEGDFNKVPVWMGMNTAEGLLIYKGIIGERPDGILEYSGVKKVDPFGALVAYVSKNLRELAPSDLTADSKYASQIQERMEKFYTGTSGVANTATLLQLLQIVTDTQFLLPLLKTADYLSLYSSEPVYNYLFSYDGPYACFKVSQGIANLPGTCHGDELGYLFIIGPIEKVYNHKDRYTPQERVIDLMTTTWTYFAKMGQPTPNKECLPFTKTEPNYCDIGVTLTPKRNQMDKTVKFWNDLYEMVLGKRPFPQ